MKLTIGEAVMPGNYTEQGTVRTDIGYAAWGRYDDCVLLIDIFVEHNQRGWGHGSVLLEKFMREMQDETVVLYAAGSEFASFDDRTLVEWYKRHGFKDHAGWKSIGPFLVSQ